MSPNGPVAGIVLAAGAARRMGHNKMILRINNESMAHRAVRTAIIGGLDPVIVVAGFEPDRLRDAVADLACRVVENPAFEGPTSGSLHAGLRALPAATQWAAVILADMVRVSAGMLAQMHRQAVASDAPLVVSRYGDVFAPPLVFHRALFDELLAWHGDGCGKAVVMAHQHEAQIIDWPIDALVDIDTPEDYLELIGQ